MLGRWQISLTASLAFIVILMHPALMNELTNNMKRGDKLSLKERKTERFTGREICALGSRHITHSIMRTMLLAKTPSGSDVRAFEDKFLLKETPRCWYKQSLSYVYCSPL